MPSIQVFAAVITEGEHFLVCQRPKNKRHGLLWEFPGGKVEAGEDMLMAARRELREELSLEVESLGKLLFVAHDPGSDFLVNFIETIVLGKPQLNEHADLRWVRKHEFRQLNFAPSDERFINFQINGLY